MKKIMMAVLMVVSAQSAMASTNLLDRALNSGLKDKRQLQWDHAEAQARPKAVHGDKLNAKYETIEVGDEMGSFAAAHTQSYHSDTAISDQSNSAKELKALNAEISETQNL